MLGILPDLGDVPKVNILGDVVGEEVGESVSLGGTQPRLRLPTESTLIHPFTTVTDDFQVKDAQRVLVNSTLNALDSLF